jgi:hypothetical protein
MALSRRLLRKPFGQFDEDAPIRGIPDFIERDYQPQTFGDGQIDLIVPKQSQQFFTARIGIVRDHGKGSKSE